MFADLAMRLETALDNAQTAFGKPIREGRAILGAFAALQAIRDIRHNSRGRHGRGDDEDALFI